MVDSYKQQLLAGEASAIESLISCEEMDVLVAAGSSALPALETGVQDSSYVVQATSMFTLGKIVANDLSLANEIVPLLITVLEDSAEDITVRSVAAKARLQGQDGLNEAVGVFGIQHQGPGIYASQIFI
jgi:hypothetical protein